MLLGSFNPAIFTPAWFARQQLLPFDEVNSVNLGIVHNQVTDFQAEWFHLNVTPEQFSIDSARAPQVRIRDIVLRLFGEILPHTPLNALGINFSVHFRAKDQEERDRIRVALAPPSTWGPLQNALGLNNKTGGMRSLTMAQLNPEDRPIGSEINVTVELSNRVGGGKNGIYASVNHHFLISDKDEESSRSLIELFNKYYDSCNDMSTKIIEHVMTLDQ